MGYSVQNFEFKIGDPGITQQDDGINGVGVDITITLTPPFGGTIINVIVITPTGGGPFIPNTSDNPAGSVSALPNKGNFWDLGGSLSLFAASYPLATGTSVLTVTTIVAD